MLRVTRSDGPGRLRIALSGVIDDTVDLAPVFTNLPPTVELDLRGIERINSVGVRKWVALMGKLSAKHRFTIEAVSYPIVMQAICVHRFFGDGTVVESCMAPYFCPNCSRPENVVVRRDEVARGLAEKRCSSCSEEMYFDELDQYFRVFEAE